jgi:hypothetical protein
MRTAFLALFTGIISAAVALTFAPHASFADQFLYGGRVAQIGDMIPQTTAQKTFQFVPILGAGASFGGPLVQPSPGTVTKKVAMVSGLATFTFPVAFTVAPTCPATVEGSDASATANAYVVVTTTACVYHSGDAADVRTVDFGPVIGNPN